MKESFGTHKIILFGTHRTLLSPFILLFNRTYLYNTIAVSTFQLHDVLQSCDCNTIMTIYGRKCSLWILKISVERVIDAIKFLHGSFTEQCLLSSTLETI